MATFNVQRYTLECLTINRHWITNSARTKNVTRQTCVTRLTDRARNNVWSGDVKCNISGENDRWLFNQANLPILIPLTIFYNETVNGTID